MFLVTRAATMPIVLPGETAKRSRIVAHRQSSPKSYFADINSTSKVLWRYW